MVSARAAIPGLCALLPVETRQISKDAVKEKIPRQIRDWEPLIGFEPMTPSLPFIIMTSLRCYIVLQFGEQYTIYSLIRLLI